MAKYITVRFGEGQEAIFNPYCRSVALLRSIRDRCQEDGIGLQYAEVDLSDESGNIKFLRDTPFRYANEVLNDRESLIALRVDKQNGTLASYTPLLKDDEAITEEFLARLCVREDVSDERPDSSRRAKSTHAAHRLWPTRTEQTAAKAKESAAEVRNKRRQPVDHDLDRENELCCPCLFYFDDSIT